MDLKKWIRKPPCPECPYKLGLIHTLVNPCPACRENGYQTFTQFQTQGEAPSAPDGDRKG